MELRAKLRDYQYIHERLLDENEQLRARLIDVDSQKERYRRESMEAAKLISKLRRRLSDRMQTPPSAAEVRDEAAMRRALAVLQAELSDARNQVAVLTHQLTASRGGARESDAEQSERVVHLLRLDKQQLAMRLEEESLARTSLEAQLAEKARQAKALADDLDRQAVLHDRLVETKITNELRVAALGRSLEETSRRVDELQARLDVAEHTIYEHDHRDEAKSPQRYSIAMAYLQAQMVDSARMMQTLTKELKADNANLSREVIELRRELDAATARAYSTMGSTASASTEEANA